MATFYIDPTVATNGDGSLATPFNSWGSVTWSFNNIYLQKENSIFNGSIIVGASNVILGTYLSVSGLQTEDKTKQAIIDANGAQLGIHNNFISRSSVTINNLWVKNCAHTTTPLAIYCNNSGGTNWLIKNCRITDVLTTTTPTGNSAGIKLFVDNARIFYCDISNISDDGILVEGDNVEIAYNRIWNISVGGLFGDNIQVACGVISANNCWVHHNWCDHTNQDSKQCIILSTGPGGITGGVVEDNICLGYINSINHKTVYSDSANSIWRRNLIFNGWWGAQMADSATGAVFESNLIVLSSVLTSGTAKPRGLMLSAINQQVYNNTIISLDKVSQAVGIEQQNYVGIIIKNNIVTGWKFGIMKHLSNPATETYNCLYNNTSNVVSEAEVVQTIGTGTITTNANLSTSYTPKESNTGVFVAYSADINNQLRKNPPSIGAYEYIAPRADAGIRGTR